MAGNAVSVTNARQAEMPPGVFTRDVPPGGSKTLTSLGSARSRQGARARTHHLCDPVHGGVDRNVGMLETAQKSSRRPAHGRVGSKPFCAQHAFSAPTS
jgi:hypothetical protein